MLYLANPCGSQVIEAMGAGHIGLIDSPGQRWPTATRAAHALGATWCADNSCFGAKYPGDARWLTWLELQRRYLSTCLFATAPDVVGDAAATLARSEPFLPAIRAKGYRAALVAQDGLEDERVPWHAFDVLFIGGTTDWKLGQAAAELSLEARDRGKAVHVGRVNSRRRYVYAATQLRADTADGTFLTFGPDKNLPIVLSWRGALSDAQAC